MLDFLMISTRSPKKDVVEIFPVFKVKKSSDLMIRGGDFYAIWDEERGLWSTDEDDVSRLVDRELDKFAEEYRSTYHGLVKVMNMWNSTTGTIDSWHKYCQKQMRDSFTPLDEKLVFSNDPTNKKDYASKRLDYPLEPGDITAYDTLISTLYSKEERAKIEWAIGAIVTGDSKTIQKFLVLYGGPGTGKSTLLKVIEKLFKGYYSVFDAKALGSNGNQFALEAFRKNPLVAIQHDGDLSRIEDNTRLNSLVSHEEMTVNEKYTKGYSTSFKAFLFMGTNKPVKITDAKSGIIRRLIDVTPSGNKLKINEYRKVMKQIDFELGAIAYHCKEVYLSNPGKYDDYIPITMMGASNDFYNFVVDAYHVFKKEDGTTMKAAWVMYKDYCDDAKVPYPLPLRNFKEELKNYFSEYKERHTLPDGTRVRNYYDGFMLDKFENNIEDVEEEEPIQQLIQFDSTESIFDRGYADCPAQLATSKETPREKWEDVKTKLAEVDTSKVHYVMPPENHIVIDFDIPDKDGNKSYERNLEEASKWPATYAELSKSGAGIHLHYIYKGDVSKLSRVYDEHVEIKVFTGKSSLRRKLTKCNNLPIATISSGLPLKGDKKMVNREAVKSEKGLRTLIKKNLNKEFHPATKPSIDFIYQILEDAYKGELCYDVTDMRNAVLSFAASSTNQSDYCIKRVTQMKFKSDEASVDVKHPDEAPIVFYDVEVFPNLFLVNWKFAGEGKPVVRMINPKPHEIEELFNFKLIGFNCRRYDNHMLYACHMGYTNEQLYNLSQKIVGAKKGGNKDCFFGEAYNISYTDVYDFASAGNKKSLKKWEIELGIHHKELGLPWDQPVPEERWIEVAEYCDNDVIATEAVFNHLTGDWVARQILAEIAGMTYNDTTNALTTKIIFGRERKPQSQFYYRNMAEPVKTLPKDVEAFIKKENILPIPFSKESLLPYFPGYEYKAGVSTYRGVVAGEGGYVYAEPGMYGNVALLDVASMHPSSTIDEVHFGPVYTKMLKELKEARVHVKREEYEAAKDMMGGKLTKHVERVEAGELTPKDLANGLKTAINSVYGLTAASFDNPFHDPRNIDNIVAKRGALFMIDLKEAVQAQGYTVVHIKTDSIKIADATPEIIDFVMKFGRTYGYDFEHEATYDRICLVNNSVYIARYAKPETCEKLYGYVPGDNKKGNFGWTATGAQFAVPYVFKTLFSKEDIEFSDLTEMKEVKTALFLDLNEGLPDVTEWDRLLEARNIKMDKRTKKQSHLVNEHKRMSDEELRAKIAEGHDYRFIGKVGNFCPIKPGFGGGELFRIDKAKDEQGYDKYYHATGAKGYRWLEAEMVYALGDLRKNIDYTYFNELVDAAADAIGEYGDLEWFLSDETYEGSTLQTLNECPF